MSKKSNKDFRNAILSASLENKALKKALRKYKMVNKEAIKFANSLPYHKDSEEHLTCVTDFILKQVKNKFCVSECFFLISIYIRAPIYSLLEENSNIYLMVEGIIYTRLATKLGIDNFIAIKSCDGNIEEGVPLDGIN